MVIGKVMSVDYNKIRVKISSNVKGNSVNIRGEIYYFGNIGSYLKVDNAIKESIICEVISIFDAEIDNDIVSFNTESNRELLIKPIGTIDINNFFNLGIGIYPGIYSDVSILTFDDMKIFLRTNNKELLCNNIHKSFHLGISKNLINYPISINIDNFFNIHSAILGNSGSGKSNTIAHIIQEIHRKNNYSAVGSKILIFDVNGEYKEAFNNSTNPKIKFKYFKPNISEDDKSYVPFYLPHFLLSLDEWSSFLLATDATQRPFWDSVIQECFRFYSIANSEKKEKSRFENYFRYRVCNLIYSALRQADSDTTRITTAASILGTISSIIRSDAKLEESSKNLLSDIYDLQRACTITFGANHNELQKATDKIFKQVNVLDAEEIKNTKKNYGEFFDYKFLKVSAELILLEEDARGNKQIRGYTATMLTRLNYFLDNPDCNFMRNKNSITTLEDYLNSIWGGNDNAVQLTIIDTSELSPDILETVTSVTSRILFDERKKLIGDNRRKKPIHIVLDEAHRYIRKNHNYMLKENIFEKIAREGRKYSFYLLVSSQRPSELSETVLSQCSNFIIHRIQNERDMQHIRAILPYFSDDFVNKIKQSTPGEALVFGNCVPMPLHLQIQKADPSPNSKNCNIPKEWFINDNSVNSRVMN